jgi:nucleoside-diphosphate-sugar epimerase
MKKVLIIGYGDIGSRIAARLPNQEFIGVSRSAPADLPNVEFIQQDWINESKLILPSIDFSTIVLILKPTSPDIDGYQQGFLDASYQIMDFFNNNISYERLVIVSSTRVYGLDNGRNITEAVKPLPDDKQARIILEYEEFVSRESKVEPLILRPSGLI